MAKMLHVENEDRRGLSDAERGRFYQHYMKDFGLSTRELERELGVDQGSIVRCVGIADTAKAMEGSISEPLSRAFEYAVTEIKYKEASKLKDEAKKVQVPRPSCGA